MTIKLKLSLLALPLFTLSVTSFAQDDSHVRWTSQSKLLMDFSTARNVIDICFNGAPDGRGGVQYFDNGAACMQVRTAVELKSKELPLDSHIHVTPAR